MPKRILVLDDDPAVAALYAEVLRGVGHEIAVCHTFEEARSELKRLTPDGVVTDVRLGEYNGLQIAILFRSAAPNGLVLVVSGHADPDLQKEAAALNARFVLKPVDLDLLIDFFGGGGRR
jgi:DNA-binding NtrC family response regulator